MSWQERALTMLLGILQESMWSFLATEALLPMEHLDQGTYLELLIDLCSVIMFESWEKTLSFLTFTVLVKAWWHGPWWQVITSNRQECASEEAQSYSLQYKSNMLAYIPKYELIFPKQEVPRERGLTHPWVRGMLRCIFLCALGVGSFSEVNGELTAIWMAELGSVMKGNPKEYGK